MQGKFGKEIKAQMKKSKNTTRRKCNGQKYE